MSWDLMENNIGLLSYMKLARLLWEERTESLYQNERRSDTNGNINSWQLSLWISDWRRPVEKLSETSGKTH